MRSLPPGHHIEDRLRVTKLTSYVRQLRLDEIPQIFSILRGEMSFIGPRPLPPQYTFDSRNPLFPDRYSVKPGILGLAQLYGGEMLPFNHRLKIDLIYVRNQTLCLDILILGRTLKLFFAKMIKYSTHTSTSSSLPNFS